jgi:hypothetical protein
MKLRIALVATGFCLLALAILAQNSVSTTDGEAKHQ